MRVTKNEEGEGRGGRGRGEGGRMEGGTTTTTKTLPLPLCPKKKRSLFDNTLEFAFAVKSGVVWSGVEWCSAVNEKNPMAGTRVAWIVDRIVDAKICRRKVRTQRTLQHTTTAVPASGLQPYPETVKLLARQWHY